jgi:hypothetical protein
VFVPLAFDLQGDDSHQASLVEVFDDSRTRRWKSERNITFEKDLGKSCQ